MSDAIRIPKIKPIKTSTATELKQIIKVLVPEKAYILNEDTKVVLSFTSADLDPGKYLTIAGSLSEFTEELRKKALANLKVSEEIFWGNIKGTFSNLTDLYNIILEVYTTIQNLIPSSGIPLLILLLQVQDIQILQNITSLNTQLQNLITLLQLQLENTIETELETISQSLLGEITARLQLNTQLQLAIENAKVYLQGLITQLQSQVQNEILQLINQLDLELSEDISSLQNDVENLNTTVLQTIATELATLSQTLYTRLLELDDAIEVTQQQILEYVTNTYNNIQLVYAYVNSTFIKESDRFKGEKFTNYDLFKSLWNTNPELFYVSKLVGIGNDSYQICYLPSPGTPLGNDKSLYVRLLNVGNQDLEVFTPFFEITDDGDLELQAVSADYPIQFTVEDGCLYATL